MREMIRSETGAPEYRTDMELVPKGSLAPRLAPRVSRDIKSRDESLTAL